MKKKKKYNFNKKRLLCGILVAVLSLSFFVIPVSADDNYDFSSVISDDFKVSNLGKLLVRTFGPAGMPTFRMYSLLTNLLSFDDAYWDEYNNSGQNSVTYELNTPVNEGNYKKWNSRLLTYQLVYDIPYENSGQGYSFDMPYPLATGIDLSFLGRSWYGLYAVDYDVVKNQPINHDIFYVNNDKMVKCFVYVLPKNIQYSIGYEMIENRGSDEEVIYSGDFSGEMSLNDYFPKDKILFSNSDGFGSDFFEEIVPLNLEFSRPILVKKIVINIQVALLSTYNISTFYSSLSSAQTRSLEKASFSCIFYDSSVMLHNYWSQDYANYFDTLGLYDSGSDLAYNIGSEMNDFMQNHITSGFDSSYDQVVSDNIGAVSFLGSIITKLSNNYLVGSIVVIGSIALVFGAFIGVVVFFKKRNG